MSSSSPLPPVGPPDPTTPAQAVSPQSALAAPAPTLARAPTLVPAPAPDFVRPDLLRRQDSSQTHYMVMLLGQDDIPRLHGFLSAFFTWILLAGFLTFPGTFTTIENLEGDVNLQSSHVLALIVSSIKSIPLLILAGICTGIGVVGMIGLWFVWRRNYVWLLNSIFIPGFLNSSAGVLSTLINVYFQQYGSWSLTAKINIIATGSCMVSTFVLYVIYNFWALEKVKRSHDRGIAACDDELPSKEWGRRLSSQF